MQSRSPEYLRRRTRGLTLVEVLVALAVLGALSLIAYRALDSTLRVRERVSLEAERWRQVAVFFNRLQDDLDQPATRGPRIPEGDRFPVWSGSATSIDFATTGLATNPLRHVRYRWQADRIELFLWPAFDAGPTATPEVHTVVTNIRYMRFSYLTRALRWVDAWPQQATDGATPRALRIEMVLGDGAAINRIFALP